MGLKGVRWFVSFSTPITMRFSKPSAYKYIKMMKRSSKRENFKNCLSLGVLPGTISIKNKQQVRFLRFKKGN